MEENRNEIIMLDNHVKEISSQVHRCSSLFAGGRFAALYSNSILVQFDNTFDKIEMLCDLYHDSRDLLQKIEMEKLEYLNKALVHIFNILAEITRPNRKTILALLDASRRVLALMPDTTQKKSAGRYMNLIGLRAKKEHKVGYAKLASKYNRERLAWQVATIFVFILFISFLSNLFFGIEFSFSNVIWVDVSGKILVSKSFLLIALFFAKQASDSNRMYKMAKLIELELATFDSYLSEFNDPVLEDKVREKMAENFFGNAEKVLYTTKVVSTGKKTDEVENLKCLAKDLAKIIKELKPDS